MHHFIGQANVHLHGINNAFLKINQSQSCIGSLKKEIIGNYAVQCRLIMHLD